jgi:uncharacterized protein (DUF1499 family)
VRFPLLALVAAALGLLLLAAAGPLYQAGASLPTAFALLRWGAYVGLGAAALGLAAGVVAYRARRHAGTAIALVALIAGVAAAWVPFSWQRRAQSVPPIHDISTDLENPPAFEAIPPLRADAPNTLERPPELADLQRQGYPDLAPVTLPVPLDQAFDRALAVAQNSGWEIVTADKSAGRIEATDTTRWFGFKDDVVVRLTPWGAGTRVDVRSVSRVGRSDVGTNAARIEAFLDQLRG